MEREKVVVVLLLITIILSIVSVVLTLAVSPASASSDGATKTIIKDVDDQGSATIGFEITEPAATGGAG